MILLFCCNVSQAQFWTQHWKQFQWFADADATSETWGELQGSGPWDYQYDSDSGTVTHGEWGPSSRALAKTESEIPGGFFSDGTGDAQAWVTYLAVGTYCQQYSWTRAMASGWEANGEIASGCVALCNTQALNEGWTNARIRFRTWQGGNPALSEFPTTQMECVWGSSQLNADYLTPNQTWWVYGLMWHNGQQILVNDSVQGYGNLDKEYYCSQHVEVDDFLMLKAEQNGSSASNPIVVTNGGASKMVSFTAECGVVVEDLIGDF